MSANDPLSLGQVKRLAGTADTILLRATRTADLETPIGAFLRLDDGGPAYLLESVEGGERLGRYSFLGVGPRRLLQVRDGIARMQTRPVSVDRFEPDLPIVEQPAADPLLALRAFVPRRRVMPTEGMPRFTGGAVGALAYDAVSSFEPSVTMPDADPVNVPLAAFIETDLVLVFDHLTHTLSAIASLHTESPDLEGRYAFAERAIFEALDRTARPSAAEMNAASRIRERSAARSRADGARDHASAGSAGHSDTASRASGIDEAQIRTSLGRDGYENAVRAAKDAIAAGEAIQVVLARRQSIELPPAADGGVLDGIALYRALRRINPSPYLFYVRMPTFEVVGASPELLLQVEGDRLTTHPLAGTRPRGATAAEDQLLSEQLQRDPKERAEHVMLVDLGRNDLGRVARPGTVTVTKYMEVEKYSHVLHLVSHVEARLRKDLDALDALRAVFPAGTLSGAPKVRAMQLIAGAERERRGLYGGAVGYLGYDGNLDTAITIRSAVLRDGIAHVHTGAGIVAGSVPEREFEETEHKAAAVRRAIELAAGLEGPTKTIPEDDGPDALAGDDRGGGTTGADLPTTAGTGSSTGGRA
jgi:anthranilate synthase component 1